VVYFSSTSVYGDTRGGLADEQSTPAPRSVYAQSKLDGESVLLDEAPHATVLRVGAVYGPSQRSNYLRLATLCRRGIQLVGSVRRTLVFETDVMSAALMAAEHRDVSARIFNVTDGTTHTLTAITSAMVSALGPGLRMILPVSPVRALARFSRTASPALQPLIEDSAVDGRRIQRELGFTPAVTLDAGWKLTIREWRTQGVV
jgi:nucleoside-diphosphate-sugar epimerase